MRLRFPSPAAALAAVLLLGLPGAPRAERPPILPLEPLGEVFDSDPWRPDVDPRRGIVKSGDERLVDDAPAAVRQPARRESAFRITLRHLLRFLTGGAR